MLLVHLTLFAYLENDEEIYKIIASIGAVALFLFNCGSLYVTSRRKGVADKLKKPGCSTLGLVLVVLVYMAVVGLTMATAMTSPAHEQSRYLYTATIASMYLVPLLEEPVWRNFFCCLYANTGEEPSMIATSSGGGVVPVSRA